MYINQNKKLVLLLQKETLLKKKRFSSLAKPTCWLKKAERMLGRVKFCDDEIPYSN